VLDCWHDEDSGDEVEVPTVWAHVGAYAGHHRDVPKMQIAALGNETHKSTGFTKGQKTMNIDFDAIAIVIADEEYDRADGSVAKATKACKARCRENQEIYSALIEKLFDDFWRTRVQRNKDHQRDTARYERNARKREAERNRRGEKKGVETPPNPLLVRGQQIRLRAAAEGMHEVKAFLAEKENK